MSLEAITHVWKNSRQKGGKLLVLLALADFAGEDGYCWPSLPTLAEKSRLSVRGVQKVLLQLEEAAEIKKEARARPNGSMMSNGYIVVMPHGEQSSPPTVNKVHHHGEPQFTTTVNPSSPLEPSDEPSVESDQSAGPAEPVPAPELSQKNFNEVPILLRTPEFLEAWRDWCAHRRENRWAIKPGSQHERAALAELDRLGVDRAVSAIRYTIKMGWRGLREEMAGNQASATARPRAAAFA